MAEVFNFDDFFIADTDEGMSVDVMLNGRAVPLKIKKSITLADLEEAKASCIKVGMVNGVPEITSIDEYEFTILILLKTVKSWPFTFADGTPVPITRAILSKMMADNASVLQQTVLNMVQKRAELTVPFAPPSVAPSSLTPNQET